MPTEDKPMKYYYVLSSEGLRGWWADDAEHAREQHLDAFPEERIRDVYLDLDNQPPYPE